MNKLNVLILTLIFSPTLIFCQKYDIPYELQQAYKKGTRDFSGNPGPNYYQNTSDYSIKVIFDPETGLLKGTSKIHYKNNSPDSLYFMVIRLYHDIMRKGNIRDEEVPPESITNGINIHSMVIDNTEYMNNPDVFYNRLGTNLFLSLPGLLTQGNTISIAINWSTQLPKVHLHRFGNYGKSNWFVAYWFPQVAVYDDINGWDQIDYTGSYEFYNDFSNFDIEIIVPKDHMVWATGNWENPEEILGPQILEKYKKLNTTKQEIKLIQTKDWEKNTVLKKAGKLKYHFTATDVTDFAFAVSGSYLWDAAPVITDSAIGKRTVVHAVYPASSNGFADISAYGARVIKHFSDVSIGIPYPFSNVTIYNGDGGMEFPMMVNQRDEDNETNHFVAMHELFHAYFPFMTGLNERKYAWLDEGLTSYLPMITESHFGGHYFTIEKVSQNYWGLSGSYDEPSLMTPSNQLKGFSYYHQAYWRSTMAFYVLEQYLGREKFRQAVREFALRWKGKHPTGFDFIFTLEDVCNENLEWLIKPWFFERGWIDLGISSAYTDNKTLYVELENVRGYPIPFTLYVTLADGQTILKHFGVEVWKGNRGSVRVQMENVYDYEKIKIGGHDFLDKDYSNNQFFSTYYEPEEIK